jgi:hypothetical protein
MTLVEKIDCSVSGEIVFVCTSVDTPSVPKVPGKNRNIVKVNGIYLYLTIILVLNLCST